MYPLLVPVLFFFISICSALARALAKGNFCALALLNHNAQLSLAAFFSIPFSRTEIHSAAKFKRKFNRAGFGSRCEFSESG
jgi:hypothetical protein